MVEYTKREQRLMYHWKRHGDQKCDTCVAGMRVYTLRRPDRAVPHPLGTLETQGNEREEPS